MTPNPQRPQVVIQQQPPAPPNAMLALVGGFIAGPGSMRRMVTGAVTIAVLALNNKLQWGIPLETQALIAGVAVAMITGSNAKEAIVSHAQADELAARHEANAAVQVAQLAADNAAVDAPAPAPEPAKAV